jgi:hypothetical protein
MIKVLISSLLFVGSSVALNPSIGASLDIKIIEQAKEAYFDYVLKKLDGMAIPNINFNHGHMNKNVFNIVERANAVNFTLDKTNNAIVLSVSDLTATFATKDISYKHGWYCPRIRGSADVSMKNVGLSVGIKLATQVYQGKTIPAFQVVDVNFHLSKSDLGIHLHGGLIMKIANTLKGLFKGIIT